ncbi:MAG: hypothetical protein M1816_004367, partial [Peltula sp. TS41687]
MNSKMKLEDDYLITLLFNSLPGEYETVIETIQSNEAYKELNKVLEVLKIREDKIKEKAGGHNEALPVKSKPKWKSSSTTCHHC